MVTLLVFAQNCNIYPLSFNRTNQKDTVRGVERLDSVIIVLSQSRWGQHFGHGEAKIAEPKENNYVLAWNLCRLAFFNKNP